MLEIKNVIYLEDFFIFITERGGYGFFLGIFQYETKKKFNV